MSTPAPDSDGDGGTNYCWDCGEPVTPEMEFCSNCGANLDGPTDTETTEKRSAAAVPHSRWYPYVFVGVVVAIAGFVAMTASSPGGVTTAGSAVAGWLLLVGYGTLAVAVYRDVTHVDRHTVRSPRRWFWTIGSILGGVNVVVVPTYVRLRTTWTGQSWVPRNPLRVATDDLVAFDLTRAPLTLSVFLFYNWLLWFVAPDLGSVLVSLISVWKVIGTSAFGGPMNYAITGYSAVGGVVSLLAAHGLVWKLVDRYGD
ncbi:MAG: zinc ribbon domain-containing protein [Halorientalis sp.]